MSVSTVPPGAPPPHTSPHTSPRTAPHTSPGTPTELPAESPAAADLSSAHAVAARIVECMHVLNRFKASLQGARANDLEWVSNAVLFSVVSHGPIRAGALAESIQADPSTVSRQVSGLVKAGLIERRADPEDGRASLLVATAQGTERYERMIERRDVHYGQMLAGWSDADRRRFADLLDRFTQDFDSYKQHIFAEITGTPVPATREEQ